MTVTLTPIRGPADYHLIVPGVKITLPNWIKNDTLSHYYEIMSHDEGSGRLSYQWVFDSGSSRSAPALAGITEFRGYMIASEGYEYVPTQEGDRDDDI